MNRITIKGRISSEIELKTTSSGKEVANFNVAVNRKFNRDETDFFACNAWGKTGVFVDTYFKKGQEILLSGEMQCRKWKDDNGNNRYSWELIVSDVEFCGSKSENQNTNTSSGPTANIPETIGDFEEIDDDEDVPF